MIQFVQIFLYVTCRYIWYKIMKFLSYSILSRMIQISTWARWNTS